MGLSRKGAWPSDSHKWFMVELINQPDRSKMSLAEMEVRQIGFIREDFLREPTRSEQRDIDRIMSERY